MTVVLRTIFASLVVALLAAGAAVAQPAQTPQGAQSFLSLLVSQGTTRVDVNGGAGWNAASGSRVVNKCVRESYNYGIFNEVGYRTRCFDNTNYSQVTGPSRALISATSMHNCETRFAFADYRDGEYVGQWKIGPTGYAAAVVNWGKIAKVSVNGAYVEISPSQPALRFVTASEDIAKRVAYAMDFLRQSCDPTAATGF